MKNRIMLFFIFSLLLCTTVFASPEFYFKQGEAVDIKIPCVNNGEVCTAAAICNITVNYPSGDSFVKNKAMTNEIVFHNYTLPNSGTSGEYSSTVYCIDGNNSGANMFSFVINGIGESEENTYILMVVLFGLLLLCLILTWYFNFTKDPSLLELKDPLKYMFFNFSLLFTTLLSYFAHTVSISYGSTFSGVFFAVYLLSLAVFLMVFFFTLWQVTKQAIGYLSGTNDAYGDEFK